MTAAGIRALIIGILFAGLILVAFYAPRARSASSAFDAGRTIELSGAKVGP